MTRHRNMVLRMTVVPAVLLLASCSTPVMPSPGPTDVTRTANAERPVAQATVVPRAPTDVAGVAGGAGGAGATTPGSPCGVGPAQEPKSPDEAALAQEIANDLSGMDRPYRDIRWDLLSNDGTFAHLLVCLQIRNSAVDTWRDYIADAQFSNVGGRWRINGGSLSSRFEPIGAWNKRQASTTAASKIHAEIVHVESREPPKDPFGVTSREYLATVRWRTDDGAQHLIQYNLWFSVSGHNCLPETAFVSSDARPTDTEQQLALSLPLRADGTADVQAPFGQVTVGPDPVELMYYASATLSNRDSLKCSAIDNPHDERLRISAVDGTYLATPLDTTATPIHR